MPDNNDFAPVQVIAAAVPVSLDEGIPERVQIRADHRTEPRTPLRAMTIHAHPDDQEFTVGGTVAKWARAGAEIVSVIVTSGDSGIGDAMNYDTAITSAYKAELVPVREAEQRAANVVLGVRETVFLRYPDGQLMPSLELRRELTRLIRKYQPDYVVTGDPTVRFYGNGYINHPDHRVTADVTCDAVFPSAGTRLIFPDLLLEGLEPHKVKKLFMHGADKPDVWIDISSTIGLKVQALREHKSQIGEWDVESRMKEWAAEEGKPRDLAMAEAFRVMVLVEEKEEAEVARQAGPDSAEAIA